MRNRLLVTAIAVCALLAGCTTPVDGRGSAQPGTVGPTGRTLSTPSADGPLTRAPETPDATTSRSTTTTADPTSTSSPTVASPAPTGTTQPPPSTDDTPTVPDVLLGPVVLTPGPEGYLVFQAPSGNIFCSLNGVEGAAGVRCDLIEADYPDLAPVPCDSGDFVAGTATLDGNGTAVVGGCVSDTVIDPNAVVLPYGSNAGAGDLVCHAAEDGVTCADLGSGHGFQVARGAHRVF
ncbi:DUF6636 domain-containing protein [Nakamurella deserti]|uniref:DUF6636 domain-containing protein n=1 Tax=Nakamurella deserti TaxID=2164074 RepID=UPI0013006505|nr:DUF6636 domain-containing protein [Nakamurella deserti]